MRALPAALFLPLLFLAPMFLVGALSGPAAAQGPIVATPLPPPDAQGAEPNPEVPPAAMSRPASFPNVWQQRQGATIQALDKINARHAELTLRLGVPVKFHALTIMLKGCVVRPPDQPADAAAFLSVTDTGDNSPAFNGWMVRSAPAVSMLQHPVYDLRVTGCTP